MSNFIHQGSIKTKKLKLNPCKKTKRKAYVTMPKAK